jgi:hypothetical protein
MTSTGITGHPQPAVGAPAVNPGESGGAQPPTTSPLPLWWSRSFPGEPPQVSQARAWVSKLLPACTALDDLLIFTSELAGNAVTHTRSGDPGGWFTVELTWTPRKARVVIGDQGSDQIPATLDGQDAYLEGGRGLLLIDALSAAWGTAGDADARWVWAEADWRSQGGQLPNTPIGSNSAEMQFAAINWAYPGASPWYSDQLTHWYATLPNASASLTAPSPMALTFMLAALYQATLTGEPGDLQSPVIPGVANLQRPPPQLATPRPPGQTWHDAQHRTR